MKTYTVAGKYIRGFEDVGELWFVGKDVATALGINTTNLQWKLENHQHRLVVIDTKGGPQAMKVVSASGLLSLVFKSKRVEATVFQSWAYGLIVPYLKLRMQEKSSGGPVLEEERMARTNALRLLRR
jgi:prophage antirepressor-like protein